MEYKNGSRRVMENCIIKQNKSVRLNFGKKTKTTSKTKEKVLENHETHKITNTLRKTTP